MSTSWQPQLDKTYFLFSVDCMPELGNEVVTIELHHNLLKRYLAGDNQTVLDVKRMALRAYPHLSRWQRRQVRVDNVKLRYLPSKKPETQR